MAAKLTFESKMEGMEKVLDLLRAAEERMNATGRTGSTAFENVDRRLKDFTTSLEHITKAQSGMGGLFKSFDELSKRSNDFLGKSYKGVLDALKYEVKAFESETDKILTKIKTAEKELDSFRSKRSTMSEKEYQEGLSSRQREISMDQARAVAYRNQQFEIEQQVKMASPINNRLYDFASSMGMGQYTTWGAAYKYGPYVAGSALTLPRIGAEILQQSGAAQVRQDFTKSMDAYLAQRRLVLDPAMEARQGHVTTSLLRSMGIGIEQNAPGTLGYKALETGQVLMDSPWVQAGAAAGTTLAGGALLAAATGLPTGGMSIAALLGATGVAGITAFQRARAQQRDREQIRAENLLGYRTKDREAYGLLIDKSGDYLMRENAELEMGQRAYGVEGTHNLVTWLASQGQSMDRANPLLNMMYQQGMNPNGGAANGSIAGFIARSNRFGFSEAMQRAMLRSSALNRTGILSEQDAFLGVAAGAGLTGRADIQARTNLGSMVTSMLAERGAGQDMGTVGAPLSAAIGTNAAGFNKVEGVNQGAMNFEAQTRLIQGGSTGLDMILVSKLRQLGVTNAVAIDTLIKMDLRNRRNQQAIANYTGQSLETVQKTLGEGADTYKGMFESVLGKDQMDRLNKATGGDVTTLYTSGLKAFDNTTAGGGRFLDTLKASLEGRGQGNPSTVEMGFETGRDKANFGEAANQIAVDEEMRRMLESTGKTVTEAISQAVVKGFLDVAEEVRKAGDRISTEQKTSNTPSSDDRLMRSRKEVGPYTGTKGR